MSISLSIGTSIGGICTSSVGDVPMAPLSTPVLIESANALDGAASGGATVTLDSSNKVQGANSWLVDGSGVSGQNPIYTKTAALVDDMSTWDVIAWWEKHSGYPQASQTFWQFGRSGPYNSGQPSFSQVNGNYGKGIWRAANVSEFTGSPAGSGQIDRRFRITQNAPYNNRVDVDCLMKNAGGYPTVLFTFDDNEDTTVDIAYPAMAAYGMKGSCYIAPTGASGIGVSDSMTLAELQTLYAAGWDMACDGTTDDTAMTAQASVAAAVTNINGVRTYLTSNGMPRAADHLCYPNGYFQGDSGGTIPTATQVAAVTGNGTTTVTFGAASNVLNGWVAYGKGIPLGTTVVSGGGASTSSVVLSNTVAAQTLAAAFIDESGTFYKPKLQDGLAAASYKTGRTTLGGTFYSRFGFSDQALVLPGQGVSGLTLAQMTAFVDTAISRKSTLIFYFHRITAGGGGINIATADFQGLVDYVGTRKRNGQLAVLTLSQLWDRDNNGLASLPF